MFNSASAAFSLQQVLQLVAMHEQARGLRYDRVVLSRPDLIFTQQPPPLSDTHYPRTEVAVEYVGVQAILGKPDTIFVLPSSDAARLMSRLFDYLQHWRTYRWGCVRVCHMLLHT